MPSIAGHLRKMRSQLDSTIQYALPLDDQLIPLNPLIGQPIRLEYKQQINCQHCGRATNKSYSQGYCYPCMQKLAACDMCIMKPETCHYHQGTCREPEWGERNCMTQHVVYLANSSGLKVGITRKSQVPTRWIDQGAVQAIPLMEVTTRQQSGLVEDALKAHLADKTNWRAMLKGDIALVEMQALRQDIVSKVEPILAQLEPTFGQDFFEISHLDATELSYPILEHPTKIKSLNLDKDPVVEGTLLGIKGQYWILDKGVINIRKYTSYLAELSF